jgi:ribosomal protein S18 acetylase RimI-like enzyme
VKEAIQKVGAMNLVKDYELLSLPCNVSDESFWSILSLSVGNPTPSKIAAIWRNYASESGRGLIAVREGTTYIGGLGFRHGPEVLEITNIAVLARSQQKGIGRLLIETLVTKFPRIAIEAETDEEAVGFYKANGFSTTPCKRRPQFTNRWTCRRAPN